MAICVVTEKTARIKERADASPLVMIATDAPQADRIPEPVRRAADLISTGEPDIFNTAAQGGATGLIVWAEGDRMLQGGSENLRGVFIAAVPQRAFLPVHLPCMEEADLIGLQPRLIFPGATRETVLGSCRIRGAAAPSASLKNLFEKSAQPWATLYAALLREHLKAASGIEPLKQLWQTQKLAPLLASLVLRNLVVALMKNCQIEKADEILSLGIDAYPGYAELLYLSAVLQIYQQKPAKAVATLEKAMKPSAGGYVGGGGESSYRASWLLGTIREEMGEEKGAASCFLRGVLERPAFVPSVSGILRQRFSRFRAAQLSNALCEMVRREPSYLEPVFDFFLRHRVFDPARRLLKTLPLAPNRRESLEARLSSEQNIGQPGRLGTENRPGVILEGPFLSVSGHAGINAALGCALLDTPAFDAGLEPSEAAADVKKDLRERPKIISGLRRTPARLDLTIRHCWPPDFRRPESGRFACILPWEHRAVPRAWVREIESSVDELWVPSQFVADSFTQGGVSLSRVHVIPNGFAPGTFNPRVKPWRPPGCRSCVFLFVGGTIRRKGADLLLQAYTDAFSPDDDVTLIFKDSGASSSYRHNNLLWQIRKSSLNPRLPHILMPLERTSDDELASLYRGCDALVLPYRGEGFGMPLIEAMACGKPVVTTAAGPAPEFCSQRCAYLIPAKEVSVPDPPPPFGEFTSEWTWFEPDAVQLASTLREICENREEAARRGAVAAQQIAQTHTWNKVIQMYFDRVARLTGLPPDKVDSSSPLGSKMGQVHPSAQIPPVFSSR